jgi:PE family
MSFVVAAPEALVTAASDLAGIGSAISTANAAAVGPTTGVLAAAADEVSEQLATLFSEHAVGFQQLSTQVAAFHEQFVQALGAGAGAYAAAESNAAQILVNAVNAPGTAGGVFANAVNGLIGSGGSSLLGTGTASGLLTGGGALASQAGALLRPTGLATALTAAAPLLRAGGMTNALATPAAASGSIGEAIENAYLTYEPWVQYGVNLVAYAAGFVVPFSEQINFLYYLGEPIVQAVLFNTIDFLGGTISFNEALNNISGATTASVNQFINTEANWLRGFLPPLPPLPSG